MNQKIEIKENISIMVNNLCNLTCSHCAGLALYDFLGTFKWDEWAHRYKKWSEILDVSWFSLCGGEPYLHPDLETWFDNIRKLWPNALIEIMTNGTRLSKRIELSRKFILDGNACLTVSCHDAAEYDKMKRDIKLILSPWKEIRVLEKDKQDTFSFKGADYYLNEKLVCKLQQVTEMVPPYHKSVEKGMVYFEMNGDRELSHTNCPWKQVYTFQHGLLYKCPPVTNYPEAKLQVKYEEKAIEVLEQYKGCDPFEDVIAVEQFVKSLPDSISVCELCAFDKQKDTMWFSREVVLDPSKKKQFRKFKIYQENE